MSDYFRPAGNLNDENFFKPAGNLDSEIVNSTSVKSNAGVTIDEINDYLESIVSGKKYPDAIGAGNIIVTFSRLRDMVDMGFNIVSAKCINPELIEIEFQELRRENTFKM